jgi:outer membrane protein, heavy metal efflux system
MPWRTTGAACLALALWALIPLRGAAQEWTEEQLVNRLVRESPSGRAALAAVEVARAEAARARVHPNPRLSVIREGAGRTDYLIFEQDLILSGRRELEARAGRVQIEAAEAGAAARLWSFRSDMRDLVVRLIAAQELTGAHEHAVGELRRIVEVLRLREQEGEGSRFERLRGEREMAEAERRLVGGRLAIAEAQASLAAHLAPGETPQRVATPLYRSRPVPPLDELLARAERSRADLRARQRGIRHAELQADAAARLWIPDLTLGAGLDRVGTSTGFARGAVLSTALSIPLFDTGRRQVDLWHAERRQLEATHEMLEQAVRADVAGAARVLELRQAAIAAYEKEVVRLDRELEEIAQLAYREGEIGILELLDALRVATGGAVELIEMKWAARRAQVALERAMGEAVWP